MTLTPEALADPVFAGLPPELLTLQWHGDTFELPPGAVLLAGSAAYPNQAFRYGERAYGVQFHLEVTPAMAKEWAQVPEYGEYLDRTLGPGAFPVPVRRARAQHRAARRRRTADLQPVARARRARRGLSGLRGVARADAAPFVSIAHR